MAPAAAGVAACGSRSERLRAPRLRPRGGRPQGIETCFPQGEKLTCRDPFANNADRHGGERRPGRSTRRSAGSSRSSLIALHRSSTSPRTAAELARQDAHLELGADTDPGFENRIEFHDPDGNVYVAKTFGTEVLFGKTVQKGIAARVLEYANELLQKAVVTAPIVNKNGVTIGYQPVLDASGNVQYIEEQQRRADGECDVPDSSKECIKMRNYVAVPKLMREAMAQFGWTRGEFDLKGVY